MSDRVIAQVILRASDGSSVLDPDQPITADNVDAHRVGPEVVEAATEKFRALGFEVVQTSEVGLTIAGDKERYEEVFETTLDVRSESVDTRAGPEAYEPAEPVRIPDRLSRLVDEITFPIPPEFH